MSTINQTENRDEGLRAYLTGFAKADWEALSELQRVDWIKLSKDLLNHRAIKLLEGLPTHEVISVLSGAIDMRKLIGQVLIEQEGEIASLSRSVRRQAALKWSRARERGINRGDPLAGSRCSSAKALDWVEFERVFLSPKDKPCPVKRGPHFAPNGNW